MRLENWYITDNDNGYTAPEMLRKFAIGDVYGHPTRPEGDHIRTAYLIEINLEAGYIVTKNSRYELGTPEKGYQEYMEGLKKK